MDSTNGTEPGNTLPFRLIDWEVDPASGRISRGEVVTRLEPKVMDVLVYLARHAGEVITREQLEAEVWPGVVVGYDALTGTIIKLRKALGDSSRDPQFIETIAKRGYRLIADVEPVSPTSAGGEKVETDDRAAPALPSVKRLSLPVILVLAGVLLAGLLAGWWMLGPGTTSNPAAITGQEQASIVVLPFTSLSDDPKQEYFSDGITEDLITDLSKYSGLLVISRSSSFAYKNRSSDIPSLARDLKVQYIIEGSVQRSGGMLRMNVQLVDAATGTNIWAERYDRKTGDLFQVQDELRKTIASVLQLKLTEEEQRHTARRYTISFQAYDLFLQARREFVRNDRQANQNARALLTQATTLDPGFARAYSLLALTYADEFRYSWSDDPEASVRRSIELATQATRLDPRLPHAYWVLAYASLFGRHDFEQALESGKRAIEIEPSNADAHAILAYTNMSMGNHQQAIDHIRTAMRLNPHYPSQYPAVMGYSYYWQGEYKLSVQSLERALERNPTRLNPNIYLAANYHRLGQPDDAAWQKDKIMQIDPYFSLEGWIKRQVLKDPERLQQLREDLIGAGLR